MGVVDRLSIPDLRIINLPNAGSLKTDAVGNVTSGSALESAIPHTYAELSAMVSGGTLVPEQYYLMTDFRTHYTMPNTSTIHDGSIEPLILLATSTNSFSSTVYSTSHPQDSILYEFVDTHSDGDRGRITFRHDTTLDIFMFEDWRNTVFRRWNDGNGNYVLMMNDSVLNLMITGSYAIPDLADFSDFPCFNFDYDVLSVHLYQADSSGYSNVVFKGRAESVTASYGFEDCHFDDGVHNVILGDKFNGNIFFQGGGGGFNNSTIGVSFQNNVINALFTNTITGALFQGNHITADLNSNTIGAGFEANVINSSMDSNIIGSGFTGNTITCPDGFTLNNIGLEFRGNVINYSGDGFMYNTIANSFIENQIYAIFKHNNTGQDFDNNTITAPFTGSVTGRGFRNATVQNGGVDSCIFGDEWDTNLFDAPSFLGNKFGGYFSGNEWHGTSEYNVVESQFTNNIFYSDFHANRIGVNVHDNTFYGTCDSNLIDGRFDRNTINPNFITNKCGLNFEDNVINALSGGSAFSSCIFGASCTSNTFTVETATGCIFETNFSSNTINVYSCEYNTFLDSCFGNTINVQTFSYNYMCRDFIGNTFNPVTDELYSDVVYNIFGNDMYNNVFTVSSAHGGVLKNTVGCFFDGNIIDMSDTGGGYGSFVSNTIGSGFGEAGHNTITGRFDHNQIGTDYSGKTVNNYSNHKIENISGTLYDITVVGGVVNATAI